jgi:methylmalonyl-CoA mutase
MIRNDLQHIQLDSQKSKQEPALHEQEASTAAFLRLKALNSSLPILKKILKTSITLILVLAFLPIYGSLYYYVCASPWTIRQYAGFSTAEESNAFIDVILGQKDYRSLSICRHTVI